MKRFQQLIQPSLTIAVLLSGVITGETFAQKRPSPPRTGQFSVQMFQGNTQNCWIAVYPPTTYDDDTPISKGKEIEVRVYRSHDRGRSYGRRGAKIVAGGKGFVGQGERGARSKPWIDCKLETPVDHKRPHVVYLAASVIVDGVESRAVNRYLTFRYADNDGNPQLVRYETTDISGNAVDDQSSRPLPQELPGLWTDGEFTINKVFVSEKAKRDKDGCGQAIATALQSKIDKPLPLVVNIKEIDLVGAPGLNGVPIDPRQLRHKTKFPGRLTFTVTDPESKQKTKSKESDLMGFVYDYPSRALRVDHADKQARMRMGAHFFQNATHYSMHGTWVLTTSAKDGSELARVEGTFSAYKRKP